ncbi:unnamed protein product [Closterium sp. NIES-53]
MAFIRARCVLLFASLAALLVAVAYAKKKPVFRKISPVSSGQSEIPDAFNATLFGVLEVPNNDTEAALKAINDEYGWAEMGLIIHKENGQPVWLEYAVAAFSLSLPVVNGYNDWTDICPIIMTHVHKATEGSNGPKVLDLPCKYKNVDPFNRTPCECNGFLGKNLEERTATTVRCPYVIRTGDRAGQACGTLGHTQSRCFARLSDAWRTEFGDEAELPTWLELLRQRVDIFALEYDTILTAMYALPTSDDRACYLCVPPDPGVEPAALGAGEAAALGASASPALGAGEAAALGASASPALGAGEASAPGAGESALSGTAPAQALYTFTLDSGASRSFFRDSTTLTPLSRPVAVSLADPSGGQVLAHSSTVLPCPAVPSGSLLGLHLPSFSTNLVSGADLQDQWVDQFTPGGQRVTHCTCSRTGRHPATFTRVPGSSLYTLTTVSPQAAVSASGQLAAPCSCRALLRQTLLWHHRLGHPSVQRLRSMHRRFLVSGLPRVLPPLPPSPAPPCLPCVEGRQRAAPHSSSFPPTSAPLQTLHMDVWGPARVSGQDRERYFLLVVDDYSRYTTVFPLRTKGERWGVFLRPSAELLSWGGICQTSGGAEHGGTESGGVAPGGAEASVVFVDGWMSEVLLREMHAEPPLPSHRSCDSVPAGAPHPSPPGLVRAFHTGEHCPARTAVTATLTTAALSTATAAPGLARCSSSVARVCPSPPTSFVQLQRRPRVVLSPQQLREWYAQRDGSRGTARCPYVVRTGARTGQPCGTLGHTESRCFARLSDAWHTEFGDAAELPDWVELLRLRVDIYTSDYDAILTAMYALPTSDGGDCYLCVPPDPGIEAAALGAGEAAAPGAGESALSGTASAQVLHTFTLDSGASRSFFRDRTTLTPLSRPVAVSLADPSGGPVLASFSTVLPCPAAPSSTLSGLYLPSFSTNLVSAADLQDQGVDQFTPASQRVTHCTCAQTGRHLATTSGLGLVLGGRRPVVLTGHADASWADDQATQRSSQGYTLSLGSGSVSWRSTRSSSVLGSSCEAEIYAGAMAAQELRWLTYLLTDLGEPPRSPPVLYVDNKAMLALCREHRLEHRTKHIALRYFLARELQQRGHLRLAYVASEANTADVFTKALPPGDHQRFCTMLACFALLDWSCDLLFSPTLPMGCLAVAAPHLVSMLLAPEGDPDASDIPTPRSYAEAIAGEYSSQWQTAMDAAMASWKSTGTYVDEVPPSGANIVDGMWIFRQEGVDFFQTFSPTPKMTTLRVLLHGATQRDYELHSLDFSTAFFQGSLHEEIWLRRPPGFTGSFPPGTQWSLRRPVYGLCQVPHEWHDTLWTTIAALGFALSSADPSLFLCTDTSLPPFYILVYVDDMVFATADTEALALVKLELQKRHTCIDLEPSGPYSELVGCLMYLMTCTHPDLAYPLGLLARYVAPGQHRKVHMDAAKRVLRYLCSTSGMGLVLGGRSDVVLTGQSDASWAAIAVCQEHRLEHRTKHIALRYFLARELQQRGQLRLAYVATRANTGDIFTKALPSGDHQRSTPDDAARACFASQRADLTSWKSRDAAACIALSSLLPESEEAHFTQVPTASEFLTAIKARYATPTTVSLGRLFLPFLFPDLASFERSVDLIAHLRSLDSSYRAACTDTQLALLPPPMVITIYFIATSLPDRLASVRDALLLKHPSELTIEVLESALKDVESNLRSVASASGAVPPPLFHGCTVPQLPTFTASLATATTDVTAAAVTASSCSRGRGGKRDGGQGTGGGGGGGVAGGGGGGGMPSGGGGSAGPGEASRAAAGDPATTAGGGDAQARARQGQPCGRTHPPGQCFAQLTDTVRLAYGVGGPAPDWFPLVQTYGPALWGMSASQLLDLLGTPHAMYAFVDSSASDSVYSSVASLGACLAELPLASVGTCVDTSPGARSEDASLSFTLDSGASHCFFRDHTTLTPLPAPVSVALADPTSGPVTARYTTTLPCPAVPSGSLTGFHVPSFSRNLVGVRPLVSQHVGVWIEPSGAMAVSTHFTLTLVYNSSSSSGSSSSGSSSRSGSSSSGSSSSSDSCPAPVTSPSLVRASHQVAASPQVAVFGHVPVSGPVAASCSCRSLAHPTVLWHHRTGHPSLPRLCAMSRQRLVLGLPRVLPSLPPSLAPPCGPCVEGRLRATPHSSSLRPATEPFETLHLDDYSRYTTVFPLAKKSEVTSTLIRWLLTTEGTRGRRVSCLHSDRGGEFCSGILVGFCREQGISQSWTLPESPQQNGVAERRIGLVMEIARDTSADKLSPRAVPCVFLGFPEDSSDFTFYHPPSHRFFDSRDVRFEESTPYYVRYPSRGLPVPPPPLFLTSAPPPALQVQPPPPGPAPSGVSQATPPPSVAPQVQPPSAQSSSQPAADPVGAGARGEGPTGASSGGAGVGAKPVVVGDSCLPGAGAGPADFGGAMSGGAGAPSSGPGEPGRVAVGGADSGGGAPSALEGGPGAAAAPDTTPPPHPYPTRHQAHVHRAREEQLEFESKERELQRLEEQQQQQEQLQQPRLEPPQQQEAQELEPLQQQEEQQQPPQQQQQ